MIYRDANYPVNERVDDLMNRMTLEEKVAQLCGDLPTNIIENGQLNKEKLIERFPNGHGRLTQYSLVGLVDPIYIAQITNEIQKYFVEETRLGIPVALQTENLSGYPAAQGTIFPSMLNMACTWEPELTKKMAEIIGEESRSVGITSAMSPVLDVSRDPRWGRTYETFGEDHYLISQFGINYVEGMQSQGVSCIGKHFLAYAETQGGLNTAQTRVNDRELYEVFATPFEAAHKESKLGGLMASYSEIDGLPVGMNSKISRKLLRETMEFDGMLTSDGGAVWKLYDYFKVAKTYKEAGFLAKKGGLDTEIPVGNAFRQLTEYVKSGELDEELINESVKRILRIKFNTGLFEQPYVDISNISKSMVNQEKQDYSEELAAKSIVLLENKENILPLNQKNKIAVIGPHANSLRYPVSGYTYPAYVEIIDSSKEKLKNQKQNQEKEPGMFDRMFSLFTNEQINSLSNMDTVLKEVGATSLKEELETKYQVKYAKGCNIVEDMPSDIESALEAARTSDVIVMALGGNCGWINVTGGEGKDRSTLDLPKAQEILLKKVMEIGKPIILVLYGPGIFSLPYAKNQVHGMIQAFMPGPYGGKAISKIIQGTVNPEGKLPVTIPRSVGQIPTFYNHKIGSGYSSTGDEFASEIFSGGYVNESDAPLYPFGYGINYSQYEFSDIKIGNKSVDIQQHIAIECSVKNIGDYDGSEIVQVYYYFKDAKVTRPNKQLAAFSKVKLEKGQCKTIFFEIPIALLGYYNENMEFVMEPGEMEIMLGTSSEDFFYRETIQIVGAKRNLLHKRAYKSKVTIEE